MYFTVWNGETNYMSLKKNNLDPLTNSAKDRVNADYEFSGHYQKLRQ